MNYSSAKIVGPLSVIRKSLRDITKKRTAEKSKIIINVQRILTS
jgi:hypothetical protein